MIPAHCPRIFRFLDVPDICKGGGKVENCLHDTSTLSQNHFFLGFGQSAAKLGVCKNPTLTGSLSVYIIMRLLFKTLIKLIYLFYLIYLVFSFVSVLHNVG